MATMGTISQTIVAQELARLTKVGRLMSTQVHHDQYDVVTGLVPAEVSVLSAANTRATVEFGVPLRWEGPLEVFTNRYLVPVAKRLLEELAKAGEDSYAAEPKSISEIRSEKEGDGSLRSVRDMLVEVLRAIDSGDPDWQHLNVGVLVVRRRLPGETHDTCSWRAGGPGYDSISALGLLSYTAITMVGEG